MNPANAEASTALPGTQNIDLGIVDVNVDGNGRGHRKDGKFLSYYEMSMIEANLDLIRDGLPALTTAQNATPVNAVAVAASPANTAPAVQSPAPANTAPTTSPAAANVQAAAANVVSTPNAAPATTRAIGATATRSRFGLKLKEIGPGIRRAVGLAVGALALAVILTGGHGSTEANAQSNPTTTSSTEAPATTTTTIDIAKEIAKKTPDQLKAQYGNVITGNRDGDEIGSINIDPNKSEESKENFYNELRKNPDSLAFWNACLETKTPGYDVCVADASVLQKANDKAVAYRDMDLAKKAVDAEAVIAKFKGAKFDGITVESGKYKTVGIDKDGKFYASTNKRENDGRLNWTFIIDGKAYKVQIRACDQLTLNEVPAAPAPAPTPERPTTTSTTVQTPETSTTSSSTSTSTTSTTLRPTTTSTSTSTTSTTKLAPTTTTSTSTTSTTKLAPTTTTSTSTSTSTTSTTLATTTTSTTNLGPKPPVTQPPGEVPTTKAPTTAPPTPKQPTTSIQTEAPTTTRITAPATTSVSTIVPSGGRPPVTNND